MIHRLDIHSGAERRENLMGTTTANTLQDISKRLLQHVADVASNVRIEKCALSFRVSSLLLGCCSVW
jgi:hypothetical protein